MTLTALVVPVEGEPRIVEIPKGSGELNAIYEAIGCQTIEAIEVLGLTVFLDEEGKYTGPDGGPKPTNQRVTALAHQDRSIFDWDFVCGDVIFMGLYDNDGETLSLTDDQVHHVQAALAGARVAA